MSKIICCTSTTSIGCTFLDWSINYLSGKTQVLSKQHGWINVVSDPLNESNAHQHCKNHSAGYNNTVQYVEYLETQTDYFSIYPYHQRLEIAAAELGIDIAHMSESKMLTICQHLAVDYQQIIEYMHHKSAKIVFLELSDNYPLYFLESRSKNIPFVPPTQTVVSQHDIRDKIDSLFFIGSVQKWQQSGLTATWDKRERLALDTRPFDKRNLPVVINQHVLTVNAVDLWQHGDHKILEIMNYCDMDIQKSRMSHWLSVFDRWKNIQLKTLEFQCIYQDILKAIINGHSMAIDLTFDQEVVIQHCLIYQHNLNLKTWNLEKFPADTLYLHQLLEPNIHQVDCIY